MNQENNLISELDPYFKKFTEFDMELKYLSHLDKKITQEIEFDMSTLKHGKFGPNSAFKGNRIDCFAIKIYQNKCLMPKGKLYFVVSDGFLYKLSELQSLKQKKYRIKLKIISITEFEIEEMK